MAKRPDSNPPEERNVHRRSQPADEAPVAFQQSRGQHFGTISAAPAGASIAGTASSSSSGGLASPLVELLEKGLSTGQVVKDPHGEVYTGFASFRDLAQSQCKFVPMNSNRAINRDVVRQRVQENVDSHGCKGRYLEFGQINLIVISQDASHNFLVMDGQHRCETMQELHSRNPQHDIWFQFRAKVVASEPLAFEELRHFQRAYPTDPRSFFRSRAEARAATAVLERLKARFRGVFKEMELASRNGRGSLDPPRPYLNDNLLFWLLQESSLLAGASQAIEGEGSANADEILSRLIRMNRFMASLTRADLGKNATDHMLQVASKMGCYLGFFREGVLLWHHLDGLLQASETPRLEVASGTVDASCVVCLERPPQVALLTCGHVCVCETCSAAVQAARPARCPVCRLLVEGAQRVFF